MTVTVIAAMASNRVIGRDNQLPWRLPADLKRFKRLTSGHHIVMGRRTWESIGRPLPNRTSLVVSRNPDFVAEGATVLLSLEAALERARAGDEDEVFVIGGEAIYTEALRVADRIQLTRVHADVEGDRHFPADALEGWSLVSSERFEADGKNPYAYSFEVYERP